ncbi:GNAT family N-acetyltransferase [Salisediminibacterium beveridgei]|uniref:Acetyltransferase, GNAT family n=1 Tax=Salisediminibacterium beveridgei TaxID=632773 RepID=A0A1D7QXX8_9BACI|nr:GNAT family N-acetyltransferase [Salisediminibacterium beveridgei]AOM83867.1 acetyltransferase, GNAT family [Salisediminibacterium beveridgei]
MTFRIRVAVPEDARNILGYLKQVGGESDHLLIDGWGLPISEAEEISILQKMKDDPGACMLVGEMDEKLVSIASYQASSNQRIAHHAELAVSVKKACWGKGIGRKMIEALIDEAAKSERIRILHLKVKADNERAIRLYKGLGFQEIGRFESFFHIKGTDYDAVLMNLKMR